VDPRAGLDWRKISSPRGFFVTKHTFIQVHCVHSSAYVTDTVSIVRAVRVFIGQVTSLPHTTVPFDPPLSRTLYSYTSYTFPYPLTSHCTRLQGWHTLRPIYNTESHQFLPLMGQVSLMLLCLHAPAVHAPYSNGSIAVPLLPWPKNCNKSHRHCRSTVCPSCGIVFIGSEDSSQRW